MSPLEGNFENTADKGVPMSTTSKDELGSGKDLNWNTGFDRYAKQKDEEPSHGIPISYAPERSGLAMTEKSILDTKNLDELHSAIEKIGDIDGKRPMKMINIIDGVINNGWSLDFVPKTHGLKKRVGELRKKIEQERTT